jgi:hypothetical protein
LEEAGLKGERNVINFNVHGSVHRSFTQ